MAEYLPDNKITECKEIFNMFDQKQLGYIQVNEVAQVLRRLGLNPTERDVRDIEYEVDPEYTGRVEVNNLLEVFGKYYERAENEEDFIRAFQMFDNDNSGVISAQELIHILTSLGDRLTMDEVDELANEAKIDNNGYVNYREFVSIMMTKL